MASNASHSRTAVSCAALDCARKPAVKVAALSLAIALSLPVTIGLMPAERLYADEPKVATSPAQPVGPFSVEQAEQVQQAEQAAAQQHAETPTLGGFTTAVSDAFLHGEQTETYAELAPYAEETAADQRARTRVAQVDALMAEALSHEGAPYVYGGTTPGGFDCSGFVQYCYRTAVGIELPRTSGAQAGVGTPVGLDELQPGDLVFWGSGAGAYHVGIAVDGGSYIHAAGSGQGVVVDTMAYYTPSFAMRVL